MSNYARFYKCALQVNPYSYIKYRGIYECSEKQYNNEILEKCIQNGIKIVGLANHGDSNSSESLRKILSDNGILVFPGFEIATAEKIHIVCLFPRETDISELNRLLGLLGMPKYKTGTEASNLSCIDIATKVIENNGFWYAAHITSDNGILKLGGLNNVWQNELLIAAQIPNTQENIDPNYKNIIKNKDKNYIRESLPAFINAKDISLPNDLDNEFSSTFVKMSELSFDAFKQAFKDPTSRIKLKSDIKASFQSSIDRIEVVGGYLDGLDIEFSNELNTIIGGRGTGKSTLINLIRYTLNMYDSTTKKEVEEVAKANLGANSYVTLTITSHRQGGYRYKVRRTYKYNTVVLDQNNEVSELNVEDILPNMEIYGQNELLESIKSDSKITKIVSRLINIDEENEEKRNKNYRKLNENTEELLLVSDKIEKLDEDISNIPSKSEKLRRYNDLGLGEKLEPILLIDEERSYISSIYDSVKNYKSTISKLEYNTDYSIESEEVRDIIFKLNEFNNELNNISKIILEKRTKLLNEIEEGMQSWEIKNNPKEKELENLIKKIDGIHDKSNKEIVEEYRQLNIDVQASKPIVEKIENLQTKKNNLLKIRKNILEDCKLANNNYAQNILKVTKKLNKKEFFGILKLEIKCFQNKDKIIEILKDIDGVGDKALEPIKNYENFDAITFVEDIKEGIEKIKKEYLLSETTAKKICNLKERNLWEIEKLMLDNITDIKLKVGENFKGMGTLSKGQQCTAILNILLLNNKDPLIIDQPEDNLDNAYIAENLVKILRENKFNRQYILASHNANIPVFGDAELIIPLEEVDQNGKIIENAIGSIDKKSVQKVVIDLLEGGEKALVNRNNKYNIK